MPNERANLRSLSCPQKVESCRPPDPGRKQVFRQEQTGRYVRDIIAGNDEEPPGAPLLRQVMAAGRRLPAGHDTLAAARDRACDALGKCPQQLHSLAAANPPYDVQISAKLQQRAREQFATHATLELFKSTPGESAVTSSMDAER